MNGNIFKSAPILVPLFSPKSENFTKWAVIACDQFTSDPAYWKRVEERVGDSISTYQFILPEAYLGTEKEKSHMQQWKSYMSCYRSTPIRPRLNKYHGFVFVERTLGTGKTRRGILGMIDLEAYDYSKESKSQVRATEETVPSRIPPRMKNRSMATVEFPHILVFAEDKTGFFKKAEELAGRVLYDFDLMENGGHLKGSAIEKEAADELEALIGESEKLSSLPYAVGDGNHSLAAAKAHYENLKKELGDEAAEHPARYALCEIVSLDDDAIEFEPIHRIIKGVDRADLISSLEKSAVRGDGEQTVTVITKDGEAKYSFTEKTHAMTVGTLQNFIDGYISAHDGASCDYIHGEKALRQLVEEDSVAFMFDGFEKSRIFEFIGDGPMPRKTFSMGDAESKRYYLEARQIVK